MRALLRQPLLASEGILAAVSSTGATDRKLWRCARRGREGGPADMENDGMSIRCSGPSLLNQCADWRDSGVRPLEFAFR